MVNILAVALARMQWIAGLVGEDSFDAARLWFLNHLTIYAQSELGVGRKICPASPATAKACPIRINSLLSFQL